jgi:glutamate synthase (NADPH) small chain
MGHATGSIEHERVAATAQSVGERLDDSRHAYRVRESDELTRQAARCRECGVPFCQDCCPLANRIPEWNDLVYRGAWRAAIDRLHQTNNFPEFTGLLCPAPCEGSCVLALDREPVTIQSIELAIIDRAFAEGWIAPAPPRVRTLQKVAIVGSGPAGLAAADQLNRAGHSVTVFEKSDRIGGLLRYGIPEFKLEKRVLNRRLDLLRAEGVAFHPSVDVGHDLTARELRRDYDAILLATGAGRPRDLKIPGRHLRGVHFAMDFLAQQNRRCEGDADLEARPISAAGRHVVVVGGGNTGRDCVGTALRQGAARVTQLDVLPALPHGRAADSPWPTWPYVFRTSSPGPQGGEQLFSIATTELLDDGFGHVRAIRGERAVRQHADGRAECAPTPNGRCEVPADLVLLALGFLGPQRSTLLQHLAVQFTEAGTVWRDAHWMTSVPGVFAAGDAQRGQSLVARAIDDGRRAAAAIHRYLSARRNT